MTAEFSSGIMKIYVLSYGLNYGPVDFLIVLWVFLFVGWFFPQTFWMSEVGFPALIQITGICLYIKCKSLCIHNPSL